MKVLLIVAILLAGSTFVYAKGEKAFVAPVAPGVEKIVDGNVTCYATTKTEKAQPVAFKYGSISCVEN